MALYNVILSPLVTEKTSLMELGSAFKCAVKIAPNATKVDVKNAFRGLYWVNVTDVNIINTREKFKRAKKWMALKRRPYKKAYVTLEKGQKVDFLEVK